MPTFVGTTRWCRQWVDPRNLCHRDRVAHDGAEILAHVVVARLAGLHAAHLVRSAGHQAKGALLARVPAIRPPHPHEPVARLLDMGGVPGLPAVRADIDVGDGAGTAPG